MKVTAKLSRIISLVLCVLICFCSSTFALDFVEIAPKDDKQLSFNKPSGLVTDSSGNIYVADSGNNCIRKLSPDGKLLDTWDNKGRDQHIFNNPVSISIGYFGMVYVLNYGSNCIKVFGIDKENPWTIGEYGMGDGQFRNPLGIASDGSRNIYIADTDNNRILRFNYYGDGFKKWGSKGDGNGQFNAPSGIAVDADGYIYVADTGNSRVQKLNSKGNYVETWTGGGNGREFKKPFAIAVDSLGNIYVTDIETNCVHMIYADSNAQSKKSEIWRGFNNPRGICVDKSGNIYVADTGNNCIKVLQKQEITPSDTLKPSSTIKSSPSITKNPAVTPTATIKKVETPTATKKSVVTPTATNKPVPTRVVTPSPPSSGNSSQPPVYIPPVMPPVSNSGSSDTPTPTATQTCTVSPTITPTPHITIEPEPTFPANIYTDIKSHWAKDQIVKLLKKEIISGYEDNTIRPQNFITRNETSKIVVKLINEEQSADKVSYFKDKDIPEWAIGYVNTALNFGLMKGFDDNTFRGSGNLTRAQAAALLVRLLNASKKAVVDEKGLNNVEYISKSGISRFNDYKQTHWANGCLSYALVNNIMKGYTDNTLRPDQTITRGEFFSMAAKVLE